MTGKINKREEDGTGGQEESFECKLCQVIISSGKTGHEMLAVAIGRCMANGPDLGASDDTFLMMVSLHLLIILICYKREFGKLNVIKVM